MSRPGAFGAGLSLHPPAVETMKAPLPLPTKRRSVRVAVEFPVIIVHATTRVHGQTTNLGFGGAFIRTPQRFAYGERVELWLPLLGPATLSCLSSVVRWSDDSGFGVQFLSVGARDANALSELALTGTLRQEPAKGLRRRLQESAQR
jgi:hypothetical protein